MTWYCLRLRRWSSALVQLRSDSVDVFCPMARVVKARSRHFKGANRYVSTLEPLFPGYCFVHDPVWGVLRHSSAVGSVVKRGDEVLPVSDDEIALLRTRDYVDRGLVEGTMVTVIKGPFEGLRGVVEEVRGASKIRVEIEASFAVVVQPEMLAY